MSAQSPDPSITADTVPGRRGALAASPSQAVPATDTPGGGRLPLSATERTRHRRYRHLGPQARCYESARLAARLKVSLGDQCRIGHLDGSSGQTQFLGQRARRRDAVSWRQQAVRNGTAKPRTDLPVQGLHGSRVEWGKFACLRVNHGLVDMTIHGPIRYGIASPV